GYFKTSAQVIKTNSSASTPKCAESHEFEERGTNHKNFGQKTEQTDRKCKMRLVLPTMMQTSEWKKSVTK
ncbi:hypothetical protein HAX54_044963, partial [Datura stramonium]|nr:hypothetical protein [Datura stramonium]